MNARQLPAAHGVIWLGTGLALFRRNPPLLTLLTFAYLLSMIVLNLIPVVGPVALPIVLPMLTVMLANGCRSIQTGKPFSRAVLVEGIREQRQSLLRLGALHLVATALLVLVSMGMSDPVNLKDGLDPEEARQMMIDLALLMALASPLLMAFWFSPLLTAWSGVPATKSLFFSLVACWRNWRAFTIYGLALGMGFVLIPGLVLALAGMISQMLFEAVSIAFRMLLILVVAPVLMTSVFLSYRDVFTSATVVNEIV
jgi:hypothetical protein